ncbi:MAG: DUF922 domain-containing protein [Deltaproteobacteria bacterium]|nr:DUF922 domain-containing protein [Myxococcales bacterium]MDP3212555.1 DUF922 domain-containing protein [Deltaproteobacteria bacterium]
MDKVIASAADPPGFSMVITDEPYEVVGATLHRLREVTTLLGPLRDGRRHAAYTAWELRWSYAHRVSPDGWQTTAVRVAVLVTRSLPRWSPVPSAEPGLLEAWARYLGALTLHEQGHVALAAEAGRAVLAALRALPPCAARDDLDALARETVHRLSERAREEERAYDALTDHGATQGCE